MEDISLYIHVPFCDHKCIYCDFYSIITKDNIDNYISSLKREIENYSKQLNGKNIISIFFGGGTPSLLTPNHINEILLFIKSNFNLDTKAEITLETNPGTVDNRKLSEFRDIGINRISIGVQSFNDNDLKFLTRIHNKQTAVDTIKSADKAGFENINIDLIFSIPKQNKDIWEENLELAAALPVKHISAYSLILEKGTILNKMVLDGKIKLKDEDYDASQYEHTIDFLTSHGFEQYEVSNFCKPGFECVHNLSYWEHKNYIGFGPSAHSFVDNKRWWNFSSLKMYMSSVELKDSAVRGSEELTKKELEQEFIMLALRSRGLNLNILKKMYGNEWISVNNNYINKLVEDGFIIWSDNFIKFTKAGYLLCDEILLKFQ
ncbi:MAG: radical SAM family heme chaperone HemW [Chlorobi bacterium]|nr:radical SAM family heme chaperone HemW [Chlorobiota bacterium]